MKISLLKEIINKYPDDMEVQDELGDLYFYACKHTNKLTLSTKEPIGMCPRCDSDVFKYPSRVDESVAHCPNCRVYLKFNEIKEYE